MNASTRARFEAWFESLDARAQQLVRYGALAGAVLVVVIVLLELHGLVHRAQERLARKRADAAYIASVLPELRSVPQPQGGATSLLIVVDRTTRDAGLASNLRATEPNGPVGVRVHFEGAGFDALVTWLLRVEREYGLNVQAATVEKTDTPGRVNATLSFVRS